VGIDEGPAGVAGDVGLLGCDLRLAPGPPYLTESLLVAGRDLLHGPDVAVRIAEEDEPDVVERVSVRIWVFHPRPGPR
jgi:hypothetical protein